VNAGYLTIQEVVNTLDSLYKIRILNQEVQREFIQLTEYYLSIQDSRLSLMLKYLIEEKKEYFIEGYRSILMLLSYYDLKNENSYHMMMLGMCVCLSHDYEIRSNRENGKRKSDIALKSKTKYPSFVIEFKYSKEEDNLERLAEAAIEQIKKKQYDEGLIGKVVYIGLAHHGKDVVIKWVEKD